MNLCLNPASIAILHELPIISYHLWPEWWGKIGRKGCVNQDGCIMHEWGARRPGHRGRAFFSPQRAPVLCTDHLGNKTSVTLQFSESRQWSWWQKSSPTILKSKICKCAVLWKWKWKVREVMAKFKPQLSNWAIEHARLFHVYRYVCTLTILDIRHQCIVL